MRLSLRHRTPLVAHEWSGGRFVAAGERAPRIIARRNAVLFAALACALFAEAALAGVVANPPVALYHARAEGAERPATLDPATATLIDIAGTELANCCRYANAGSAYDPVTRRLYAIATDDAGNESLHRYDPVAATSTTVALPAGTHVLALAWQATPARLVALRRTGGTHDLVAIDPASGAVTVLRAALENCCEVRAGVAALDHAGVTFAFVGRAPGATAWEILRVDLGDGTVTRGITMDAIDALAYRADKLLIAVYRDSVSAATQVAVVGDTGMLMPFGAGVAAGVTLAPGVRYVDDGKLVVLGHVGTESNAAAALSLVAFDLTSGDASTLGSFAATVIVNAVNAVGAGQPEAGGGPDFLFADGFE